MIFLVIAMALLATAVVMGLIYLFYEAITDTKKPTKKVEDIPQSTKLRFKKPNL